MNPTEIDADVKRFWVSTLSRNHIQERIHTTPSEIELGNYGNDTDVLMTFFRHEIKALIAEKVARVYVERTQAEVQTEIGETLLIMLQLGNRATSNEVKTESAWFQHTIIIELFSGGFDDDFLSECIVQWSKLDKFMKAIVKETVSNTFFIWPLKWFLKHHVDSMIVECCLTHLKTGVLLPPSISSPDVTEKSKKL